MSQKTSRLSRILQWFMPILYGCMLTTAVLAVVVVTVMLTGRVRVDAAPFQTLKATLVSRRPALPAESLPSDLVTPAPGARPEIRRAKPALPEPEPEPPQPAPTPAPVTSVPAGAAAASPQPPAALPEWRWAPLQDGVDEFFRTQLPPLGGTPLLAYAVMLDDGEWVSQLIARGADANERTPAGDTLLCMAVRLGAVESVRALLHGGADCHQPGLEKQAPLPLASLRRGVDAYRALLSAGADPNIRFHHPVSPALLDRVTIRDLRNALESDRGVTPLIACASRGDVEGAAMLMRWGADASKCTTRYHRYPINFAATQGYLFLMRIILGRNPESEPRVLVTVNLTTQRAWVTKEGRVIDSCSVSTGRAGYATPAGRYVITDKHRSWTSTLYHVAMPFFMRLNCGAIGLHSGYVTGRPASHGCIRLPYEKAKQFFSVCSVGDEVQIVY